jgi:chaperonin GroEL (HSP60 family)
LSEQDSRLKPLSHERVPVPDIYVDGKPVLVLDKRTKRRDRDDTLRENLAAAAFMQDLAKTIFGPRSLIKLISTHEGNYPLTFLTSDLQSVLKRIQIKHPAAQIIAGAAIAAHREKGDGCVSTILLATGILSACKRLLAHKTHPNILIDGLALAYHRALAQAPKLAINKTGGNFDAIGHAIENSLGGKLFDDDRRIVQGLLCDALKTVGPSELRGPDSGGVIDIKQVQGGTLAESHVVAGIALTQEIPHDRMPRRVKGARIALIEKELRIPDKKITRYEDYKFAFSSPQEMGGFEKSKKSYLEGLASNIIATKANVVLVQEGVDDFLFEYFANRNILLIRRFPHVEFERVNRIVGGRMVPNALEISEEDLGWADLVEERTIGKQKLVYIEGCKEPKSVDIVLRGGVKWSLDDIERVMRSAVKTATTAARDSRLVWGGGAFEFELARHLSSYARRIKDRRQLVLEAVAEALESIPAILGETAGLKATDVTRELRYRHARGETSAGIDVKSGKVGRMNALGVMDLLDVKIQAIQSAFETAITILRIDELVVGAELSKPERAYLERIKGTSPKALKEKGALPGS